MPNKRIPWFKCWGGITSDPKVAPLSDAVFRTWVELLDAASQQPRRGRFFGPKEAAAIVRRPAVHVAALVTAGLIDQAPDGLTMHHWDQWQRWRQEDDDDPESTPDEPPESPPDELSIDTGSTPDQHLNGVAIDTSPLRAKKREERRETLKTKDERRGDVNPPVATQRTPKGRRKREEISESEIESLVSKWTDEYGGDIPVRTEITAALNNVSRFKALNERLYVDRWLGRELQWHPRQLPGQNGAAAVCTCHEIRANLAINRNSSRICAIHGRLEDAPLAPGVRPDRPGSVA